MMVNMAIHTKIPAKNATSSCLSWILQGQSPYLETTAQSGVTTTAAEPTATNMLITRQKATDMTRVIFILMTRVILIPTITTQIRTVLLILTVTVIATPMTQIRALLIWGRYLHEARKFLQLR
jgi:hypothetical protein